MKANKFITITLLLTIIILSIICAVQAIRLQDAKLYIHEFETEYPEYIDTISGSDAYDAWY